MLLATYRICRSCRAAAATVTAHRLQRKWHRRSRKAPRCMWCDMQWHEQRLTLSRSGVAIEGRWPKLSRSTGFESSGIGGRGTPRDVCGADCTGLTTRLSAPQMEKTTEAAGSTMTGAQAENLMSCPRAGSQRLTERSWATRHTSLVPYLLEMHKPTFFRKRNG